MPLAADNDPERTVTCALAMQAAMAEINAEQRQHQLPELARGIGLHTGEVVVSNIGSDKRAKYGAVGSAINVASHSESYTVDGQILISQSLYDRVRRLIRVRGTREVQLKGLDHPVMVYDITALKGHYRRTLPATTPEVLTPLALPLPMMCFPLEGKAVADTAIAGALTHLVASTAKAMPARPVAVHTNLTLMLTSRHAAGLSAVYAKVLALEPSEAASAYNS